MGIVSLAVREEGPFRRAYAIKRLKPECRHEPRVRSMFLEEARIAGLLHHPNIVSVVDIGEDDEGPYLVMDFIQGVSLADLITDARDRAELIPVQVCVRIIKDIASGLHAAHELRGHDGTSLELVHRDVSPQNILVGFDGVARLTDFGIAKALGRPDRTNTGLIKGKVGYLSPEQLHFDEPSRRSDLFSLGVVLFELLSAKRLYAAEKQSDVARQILTEAPPDIDDVRNDVHPMLVQLLFQLLAKDPADRPRTAGDVLHRLDAVLAQLSVQEGMLSPASYVGSRFTERQEIQARELEELTAGLEFSLAPSKRPPVRPAVWRIALATLLIAGAVGGWMLQQSETVPRSPTSLAMTPPTKVKVVSQQGSEEATPADEGPINEIAEIPAEQEVVVKRSPSKKGRARARASSKTTTQPKSQKRTAETEPRSPVRKQLVGWDESQ